MTDWPVKTLGEVCEVIAGQSPEGKFYNKEGKGVPFYQGKKDFAERVLGSPTTWTSEVTKLARPGDILMSVRAPVGPVNFCPIEACIGRGLAAIRPLSKTSTDFIYYYLESIQSEIAGTEGAVFASINKAQIEGLRCPVPPLEEQKRIVELLDAATVRITELTACYEQARTHANDLLESSFLELFADAFESQPKRKMGEVLQIARGGSPRPISEYLTKSPKGVNWIKIGDASASKKYIYETVEKIKPEGVSRSRMVYPGDFLLSNSMSFGRPYIMKTEGCIHDGWLVLRDSKGELDQDFLFYLLSSRFMYEKFSQLAAGSTVQNLNSALVSSVVIPVPPINLQRKIAEKAKMLEENVARLNEVSDLRLQHAKELRQSILKAAFAGDL